MPNKTKELAKKKKKNTSVKDVPGKGLAKNAAKKIKARHEMMKNI